MNDGVQIWQRILELNKSGRAITFAIMRSQTGIPVPRPIDLLLSRTESSLVTSLIQGGPAGLSRDECSDEEMHQIAHNLYSWIADLHAVTMDRDSEYTITNATGRSCLDYRISGNPVVPFHSEKEFRESLRLGVLPDLMHHTDHKIVSTYADLNLRNILVKDGRISGIVDWEDAGWFAEYWEYTKCHFVIRFAKKWLGMIEDVFENKYEAELRIERKNWEYHSA